MTEALEQETNRRSLFLNYRNQRLTLNQPPPSGARSGDDQYSVLILRGFATAGLAGLTFATRTHSPFFNTVPGSHKIGLPADVSQPLSSIDVEIRVATDAILASKNFAIRRFLKLWTATAVLRHPPCPALCIEHYKALHGQKNTPAARSQEQIVAVTLPIMLCLRCRTC
ncbi:MAG: hypothetical protein H0T56_00440 [Pseudaminobacter sp.]|nr:hypothetical protein [Pseudaminobacter sp.]